MDTGRDPEGDAAGKPFTSAYMPHRFKLAGQRICGEYCGVLEGFQMDQEFVYKAFRLKRAPACVNFSHVQSGRLLWYKRLLPLLRRLFISGPRRRPCPALHLLW